MEGSYSGTIVLMSTNSKVSRTERRENRKAEKEAIQEAGNGLSWVDKLIARYIAGRIFKQIKNYISMKSWKTTLGGAISALGTYLATVDDPAWLSLVGQIFVGLGVLIIGMNARDNTVTSEEAGAK